jgi:hypothetical protein
MSLGNRATSSQRYGAASVMPDCRLRSSPGFSVATPCPESLAGTGQQCWPWLRQSARPNRSASVTAASAMGAPSEVRRRPLTGTSAACALSLMSNVGIYGTTVRSMGSPKTGIE